jgi:hypothetical protein
MLHFLLVPVAALALQGAALDLPSFKNGSDLLRDCTSHDVTTKAVCVAYVKAVADLLDQMKRQTHQAPCLDNSADDTTLVEMVTEYLQDTDKSQLGKEASSLALHAITIACGNIRVP